MADAKRPKIREHPESRKIKVGGDPTSFDSQTIAWQFHRLDDVHTDWGWNKLKAHQWKAILQHLRAFEGLTWAKIQEQSGGRRHGSNSHELEIGDFSKTAQDRLLALRLDDYDTVFSLRINNTLRLYGI